MPNDDGSYTRYSQGARNTKASVKDLLLWKQDAVVHVKKISSLPGGEIVKIPTENNDQIQKAIDKYIKDNDKYHLIGNNCADFVNDNLNAADDVSLPDRTIPNDYMDMLIEEYGLYKKPKK